MLLLITYNCVLGVGSDEENADEPSAPVTVKFTHNADKLKKAQEKSYKYQLAKSEEEAWINASLADHTSNSSHVRKPTHRAPSIYTHSVLPPPN